MTFNKGYGYKCDCENTGYKGQRCKEYCGNDCGARILTPTSTTTTTPLPTTEAVSEPITTKSMTSTTQWSLPTKPEIEPEFSTEEPSTSFQPTTKDPTASNWWRENWVWVLVAVCLAVIVIMVVVAILFCWKRQLFCFKKKSSGYQRGTGVEMRYSKENDNIYLRQVLTNY